MPGLNSNPPSRIQATHTQSAPYQRMICKTRLMSELYGWSGCQPRPPGWPNPGGGGVVAKMVTWLRPRGEKIPVKNLEVV